MIRVRTEAQERKESFIQMIFWAAIWLVLLQYVTACTLQVGIDWNGETKKDNRTYSDKAVK